MNYKYLNFIMTSGETVTVRDGVFRDEMDEYQVISGKHEWRFNKDHVRYVKMTEGDDE